MSPVAGHERLTITWTDGATESNEVEIEGRIPVALDTEDGLAVAGYLTLKARRAGGTAKAAVDDDEVAIRLPGSGNLGNNYMCLTGPQSDALAAMTLATFVADQAQTGGCTMYLICK